MKVKDSQNKYFMLEYYKIYWEVELTPFSTPLSLAQVRAEVRDIDKDVSAKNSVAKMLVS